MQRYTFKDGPVTIKNKTKADPQKIGEALNKIAETNEGHLTPKDVVDAARAPRHVLHRHFEWDDAAAAEAWRLEQAREIIRVIRPVGDDGLPEAAPMWLSVADKGGVSYRSVNEVKTSAHLQVLVKQQALRDLNAWQQRYRELSAICSLVREASKKLESELEEHETRSAA